MALTPRELIDELVAEGEKTALRMCGVLPEEENMHEFRGMLNSRFFNRRMKEWFGRPIIREKILPKDMVEDQLLIAEQSYTIIPISIKPRGEITPTRVAAAVAAAVLRNFVMLGLETNQQTGETSLEQDLRAVSEFENALPKNSEGRDRYDISSEEKKKLAARLNNSLVDPEAVLELLEAPKQPGGQYL